MEVVWNGNVIFVRLGSWITSHLFLINWGFLIDTLTVIMACVVTSISLIVHLYSSEYMLHDPHVPRFMSYISLFYIFYAYFSNGR